MHNVKVLAAVYLGVLAVSVLAGDLVRPGVPATLPDVELAASLEAFGACDDALAYFTEATAEQAEEARQRGAPAVTDAQTSGEAIAEQAAPAPAAADTSAAPDAFSATNVQEAGVDEPDLVKTDGRRIVTVTAEGLQVIDARVAPPVHRRERQLPSKADCIARSFRRVSSSSASGRESATSPEPANSRARVSPSWAQRRAIPNSPSPRASTHPTGPL